MKINRKAQFMVFAFILINNLFFFFIPDQHESIINIIFNSSINLIKNILAAHEHQYLI